MAFRNCARSRLRHDEKTLYIFYRWILELEVDVETVYPALYKHGKALGKLQGIKEVLEIEQLDAPDFSFPLGGRKSEH